MTHIKTHTKMHMHKNELHPISIQDMDI
jgi:hypothetical protein